MGAVSKERYERMLTVKRHLEDALSVLREYTLPGWRWEELLSRSLYTDRTSRRRYTVNALIS